MEKHLVIQVVTQSLSPQMEILWLLGQSVITEMDLPPVMSEFIVGMELLGQS